MKFYSYKSCSTCKKASSWLQAKGIEFEELAIRETPPSLEELRSMREAKGSVRPLLNSSGQDYRSLGLKEKLPDLSDEEVFALMQEVGNLVKRPFVIGNGVFLLGFKEQEWEGTF
jgi:arsenate reductase (glutaredoxin)